MPTTKEEYNDILGAKVEVMDINDHIQESDSPIVPHERQVIDDVIALWKEDPSTETLGISKLHASVKKRHPNWSLSEKRVKTLLRSFGLLASGQAEQFTYASDIKSQNTPNIDLPEKVNIVMTTKRGKGLYAKKPISKGELIWKEPQLFFIPPLANTLLMKNGKACANCGKVLTQTGKGGSSSFLKGLDCNVCPEVWCSQPCKKLNQTLHGMLKHNMFNPHQKGNSKKVMDANFFLELEDYCFKEQWNALFAVTIIYATTLLDKSNVKRSQFNAMARISQDIRYKALNSSAGAFDSFQGGALFVQEQQEKLWKDGYDKFCKVFPGSTAKEDITYEEFMQMLGTYNINNLDSSIYLVQSHLNHNCDPNTKVEIPTLSKCEGIKVFAARDIKAGEELTTTYVNPSHTVQQRQRELRVNWGFKCNCTKCKDDLKLQQRRKSSSKSSLKDGEDVREMLTKTKDNLKGQEIELEVPLDANNERRKSVRFDEKVVAVSE